MDTIYNMRDLPTGIYSTYKHEIITFSKKSIYLLYAKNEEEKKIKIWSNDFTTDNINKHRNQENFIIYRKPATVTITASYITINGQIVIEKNI